MLNTFHASFLHMSYETTEPEKKHGDSLPPAEHARRRDMLIEYITSHPDVTLLDLKLDGLDTALKTEYDGRINSLRLAANLPVPKHRSGNYKKATS